MKQNRRKHNPSFKELVNLFPFTVPKEQVEDFKGRGIPLYLEIYH